MSEASERHEFGAEAGRLSDLVVHAVCAEREIFLRELAANAADAVDRRRFEALTNPALELPRFRGRVLGGDRSSSAAARALLRL